MRFKKSTLTYSFYLMSKHLQHQNHCNLETLWLSETNNIILAVLKCINKTDLSKKKRNASKRLRKQTLSCNRPILSVMKEYSTSSISFSNSTPFAATNCKIFIKNQRLPQAGLKKLSMWKGNNSKLKTIAENEKQYPP